MATYVKGDAVANATSYELLEKSGTTYNSLATGEEINFEVSALGLAAGDHVLVVKAKADGYTDSPYSNEVTYNVPAAAAGTLLNLNFVDNTVQDYIDSGILSLENSTADSLTYDDNGLVCNDADLAYGLKLATPISVAQNWTVEVAMTMAAWADSGSSVTESIYNNFAFLSNNDDHESHANTCLAPVLMNNGGKGTLRAAENVSTAIAVAVSNSFAMDGVEHTYKFTFDATTGNFEVFVDGTSLGTKAWAVDTIPMAGNFGYVLGIHKGYSYSSSYRPKAGYKIKSIKVYT